MPKTMSLFRIVNIDGKEHFFVYEHADAGLDDVVIAIMSRMIGVDICNIRSLEKIGVAQVVKGG